MFAPRFMKLAIPSVLSVGILFYTEGSLILTDTETQRQDTPVMHGGINR